MNLLKKIENGDLVRVINRSHNPKCGIVVSSLPSNQYPSKHIENVIKSWPWHHYVLFDNLIEGPFLTCDLMKVN
jgi:hypothetical protein